jgi:dihydrofolate reductase
MVFNNISLDGYFVDDKGDMSWAHEVADAEWAKFSSENAQRGNGTLLFGRKTYEMMASFWPSDQAKKQMPDVAEGMNRLHKVVFSRSLKEATWNNTTLHKGDLVQEVKKLKAETGETLVIMGSGTIIAQLTEARLIDAYTVVVVPVVLGAGRTMFEGVKGRVKLKRTSERAFGNGNVVVTYDVRA